MHPVSAGEVEEVQIPPPEPAELPEKVQSISVEEESEAMNIPPPLLLAEFAEKVLLVSVGKEEDTMSIPPPLAPAELPEKAQFANVGDEFSNHMPPPPFAGLAAFAFPPITVNPSSVALSAPTTTW